MYAVGIRELKAKLSDYIRKARDGEVVLVTDRGRVVAELRAPTVRQAADDELGPLRALEEAGVLARGVEHDDKVYRPSPLMQPDGTARELVDWTRADRAADGGTDDPLRRK